MARTVLATLVVLALAAVASAEHAFPVHRLAQYDHVGATKGSRLAAVSLLATGVRADGSGGGSKRLNRRVAVLRMADVTTELLKTVVFTRKAGGVLILLPSDLEADVSGFHDIELELLDTEIPVPLYFAVEDERLADMYATLQRGLSASVGALNDFQLTVSAGTPAAITSLKLQNLQTWLPAAPVEGEEGSASGGENDGAPTLAVVAHYDSFSAAPSLPTGVNANGSGAATLLELARLFSVLYDSSRTQGGYNLLFVLTAAGHFNYAGAESWLDNLDEDTASSLSFVLCLDSIASGEQLYLHSAKKRTANSMKPVVAAFEQAAESRSVPLTVVHKRVNLAKAELAWEHEVFQRKRIPAATLSGRPGPKYGFDRTSLFDTKARADTKVLARNVRLVADAMGRLVYGLESPVFQGGLGIDAAGVRAWSSVFGREARSPVSLATTGSKVVDGLFERLSNLGDASRQSFSLEDGEYQFYTQAELTMTSYNVKPITFDVFFLMAVFGYCAALYVACQGRDAISSLFKSKNA